MLHLRHRPRGGHELSAKRRHASAIEWHAKRETNIQHCVRLKSEAHAVSVLPATHEQAGAHEQHHAERDLHDEQTRRTALAAETVRLAGEMSAAEEQVEELDAHCEDLRADLAGATATAATRSADVAAAEQAIPERMQIPALDARMELPPRSPSGKRSHTRDTACSGWCKSPIRCRSQQ